MYILYCNVGEMESYNGSGYERPSGGGAYNKNHIGHEVNNFTDCDGTYYGFVQAVGDTIDITKNFSAPKGAEYLDGITVIWTARQEVVGFYRDARVYRKTQHLASEIAAKREYDDYNIVSKKAQLIPKRDRGAFKIEARRRNVWYGNDEINAAVIKYIEDYEARVSAEEDAITDFTRPLEGYEKAVLIKARVNQDKFRSIMLNRFHSACCLSMCRVHTPEMLIASHIKPWSCCNNNEKVSPYNGLLLCPNHDHLFDAGYISFSDSGTIMISDSLDKDNRTFLNVADAMSIDVSEEMLPFLRYHRERIFKK